MSPIKMRKIRNTILTGIGIFAVFLFTLYACGCQTKKQEDNRPDESESGTVSAAPPEATPEQTSELILAQDGKTDFTIVIPRSAGVALKRTANRLAQRFAAMGIEIAVISDGGNTNPHVPADTHEILLGKTNRAESRAVSKEALPECGYLCFITETRFGILARDEEQLEAAAYTVFGRIENRRQKNQISVTASEAKSVDWKESARKGWLLCGVPSYSGGLLSEKLYDCGFGLDDYSSKEIDNSKMQLIAGTSQEEYRAYLKILEENGYKKEFENQIGRHLYAEYRLGAFCLYIYYSESDRRCRVIWDKSTAVSLSDFSYSDTPENSSSTVLYAYALCQSTDGLYANNCGQLEVIKLADNSLFIIDGGMYEQFDKAAQKGFVQFAREVTGTPEGEKVRIACWFFTHDHGDHRDGLAQVITGNAYRNVFALERIAFNYPAVQLGGNEKTAAFLNAVCALYPECKMLKLHTGMDFSLANLRIEVLGTHEDLTTRSGTSRIRDFNDSSTILKLSAEGVSFLLLGDMSSLCGESVLSNIPAAHLKADIVQVAHHTWNALPGIYDAAQAKYAIFTQTEGASNRTLGIHAKAVLRKVQQYAEPENCYFSGVKTSGLRLENGTVSLDCEIPLCWNSPNHKWSYVYEGWDMSKVQDYADTDTKK